MPELAGTTGAARGDVELCGLGLADLGSGGSANGGRVGPGGRAAGCAAHGCGPASMGCGGCELTMCLRLRGGGDSAEDDSSASQQSLGEGPAAEENYRATQACDGSSDEEVAVSYLQKVERVPISDPPFYTIPLGMLLKGTQVMCRVHTGGVGRACAS